ncbi:uncharacterized protein LOC111026066 [Momordica charantia]|uniref:Uncharacterized protein LOC111026066 n=1 Tax=Momordica charantia TaxID=3673 RepID=A0A6J1E0L6_MOMCH|nr:uncharacterized protein LOC111026066 [Momordica charantia]
MNSMFSLFDAFAAELLMAKTFRASSSFAPNNGSGGSVKSPPSNAAPDNLEQPKSNKNSLLRPPRLAPEFDGLNCFETLVSY